MGIGNAGAAIFFVITLVATVVFLAPTAIFLAHYFLSIVQVTSGGHDEVDWPSENISDMMTKPVYLLWVTGVSLLPAVLLGGILAASVGGGVSALVTPLLIALFAPLGLLSAMMAKDNWVPLHPKLPVQMAKNSSNTLLFFGLCLGMGLLFSLSFAAWAGFGPMGKVGALVMSPILAVLWFTYARIVGRFGFLISFEDVLVKKRKKKRPAANIPKPTEDVIVPMAESTDEEDEVSSDTAVSEPEPVLAPKRNTWDDEDHSPYVVHAAEVKIQEVLPAGVIQPKKTEMDLLAKPKKPKKPTVAWSAKHLAFLMSQGTITALCVSCFWLVILGFLVQFLRDQFTALFPGDE